MGEITRIDGTESPSEGHEVIPHQADLIEVTNGILMDTRSELPAKASFSMPIAQLATLGAGVSSLIPALHGVLWLNPGSCGKRRFDQEITFAVMTVDGNKTAIEKITIPHT